eukprot:TRINITY_DN70597_c0_g1_i1.p1 TRINITY_DN70597_c0_g1~~TRINITY_DN70597_c0_g1_i1.p1  ORF type:complete len:184 (+),score=38.49 TRINITY_DN70597_c0_g1_i1:53-604(+)
MVVKPIASRDFSAEGKRLRRAYDDVDPGSEDLRQPPATCTLREIWLFAHGKVAPLPAEEPAAEKSKPLIKLTNLFGRQLLPSKQEEGELKLAPVMLPRVSSRGRRKDVGAEKEKVRPGCSLKEQLQRATQAGVRRPPGIEVGRTLLDNHLGKQVKGDETPPPSMLDSLSWAEGMKNTRCIVQL